MPQEGDNRVIIVTGASRGLGKAIALRFGRAGCRVVVNYLARKESARTVADEISRSGGEAVAIGADVRSSRETAEMVQHIMLLWGRVDVLVNNAGTVRDGLLLRMPEQAWDDVLAANLTGPYHTIRAVADIMAGRGTGHIINISSLVGIQGREGQANYASSKAGLIGLTKACAKELGPLNIKVNAVLPGYLSTEMGDTVSAGVHDHILAENALHRVSEPEEVAEFIYRLSLMNNVSGQVFNLDSRII